MPWNAKYNQELQIIELEYTGIISGDDMKEATSKCISLGNEKGTNKFLLDGIEAKISATLFDIFDHPKQYINEKADRTGHIAVLLPIDLKSQEAARFYENVCMNRCWRAKVFSKQQDAIEWLTGNTIKEM